MKAEEKYLQKKEKDLGNEKNKQLYFSYITSLFVQLITDAYPGTSVDSRDMLPFQYACFYESLSLEFLMLLISILHNQL